MKIAIDLGSSLYKYSHRVRSGSTIYVIGELKGTATCTSPTVKVLGSYVDKQIGDKV